MEAVIGPVEAEAAGVVGGGEAGGGEATAAALLAHDGEAGQLVTPSGDLSFRGGREALHLRAERLEGHRRALTRRPAACRARI